MKKTLLLLLIITSFCNINLFSQNWFEIGTKWHYNKYSFVDNQEVVGFLTREIITDTIINDKPCKVAILPTGGVVYMYEENERVYIINPVNNEFQLFYDINSPIGFSWEIPRMDLPFESLNVAVFDTSSITLNNKKLKTLFVNINYNNSIYKDTIIERIGYKGMFVPRMFGIIDKTYRGIRCFQDRYLGFVDFDTSKECDYMELSTSTYENEVDTRIKINVFPNPSDSHFKVEIVGELSERIKLYVYNSLGMKVIDRLGLKKINDINLSNFPSGIYYIVLENDHKVYSKKIMNY